MPDPRATLRISSRQNKRLKPVRRAKDNREPDFLFLEGRKLAEEWLGTGLAPEIVVVADAFLKQAGAGELLERLSSARQGMLRVPDRLMEELSAVQTPPGLIVLAPRKVRLLQGLPDGRSFVLILHGIQDPGNLGSLLRSAEAAGVQAVIVTSNSVDALGPKALRGSMGAALRLPLWIGPSFAEALAACRAKGITVFAASPRGSCSLWEQNWAIPCAVVLGTESPGLSPEEMAQSDVEISIPMSGRCESLNVGAAGAVLLFEVARQRRRGH
jgi:TrmH family RNA methyltransferase